MKAVVLTLFATLALGGLLGCHNRQNAQQPPPLEPMQQSYTGLLPCGPACEDSESSLFLATDGSYVLEQRATGEHTLRSAQYGQWARTADTLTLVAMNGEKLRFRPINNGLEAIAGRGMAVSNAHGWRLTANKTGT
ncbi:copper resistance protein NlpE N-terminal domain-containing protein [Erwinia persicina]|uniref:Copper resistance protein NlpE N-terminal domain-containing protein n=1 Tax=Erwinia persicina TaxID=55211 RepID=A0A354DTP9_9GAMM|nr:copper resistance protein NlpE N-terminal domain-containing protein [Erwinia persicina]AXU96285.1 hypothetical protein CI789_14335 [Erwinia persicina]MBC3944358.1 copper resistance protein NlpE N-terminal domain-containing protein [Erwinia persicina]MBD8105856.1 copper resistance protein NlpE N-terminal domain-containing protein [Erwinia persicina]MBD8168433.1 copper resistance protein NlpE N-terminal domain-containing protein [Erwinia persicina]MBD8209001.1 copper resistance protein NlpE N